MISLYHSTIIVNESFNKGYLNREEYENKVKEGMSKKVQSKIKFNYSIADLRPPKGNICSDEYALLNDFIKSKTNVRIINRKYSCHTETGNKPRIDTDLPILNKAEVDKNENKNNNYKKRVLIQRIIEERKLAVNLIIKVVRSFFKKLNEKKEKIIYQIILERNRKVILIQKNFRKFFVKKQISEIINSFDYVFFYNYVEKMCGETFEINNNCNNIINNNDANDNFKSIECITNTKQKIREIKLKFGKDGTELSFLYSDILKVYYLPFKKQGVMRRRFKVNFVVDGNTIIDPRYEVDNDNTGHFFNIIESNIFKKKSVSNRQVTCKINNSAVTKIKFWENIFEIKMMSQKSNSSISDTSDRSDVIIEKLLISNANIKPKMTKVNPKLKGILKLRSNNAICTKKVIFNENVQYSY